MYVAPYAGAWIETCIINYDFTDRDVAPYAGAWIETGNHHSMCIQSKSHPTRVRGLKQGGISRRHRATRVAPYAGAWIETG